MKPTDCRPKPCVPAWTRFCGRVLICAMVALVLTCCGTGAKATRAPPPNPPPPTIPSNLRQQCPDLPQPPNDLWGTLLGNHDQVASQYHDCQSSMHRLTQAVSDWETTAWAWYCKALEQAELNAKECRGEAQARSNGGRVDPPAK